MSEPVHILSLGAGVQSSALALMATAGEITPMPIAAVFADTQDEPKSVYKWLDWLELRLAFPVYRVTKGRLSVDALRIRQHSNGADRWVPSAIPAFTRNPDGTVGHLGRQCTRDFKIAPILKQVRQLAGIKRGQKTVGAIQWIGISMDECDRMKDSRVPWAENRWPLIELNLTRKQCLAWMEARGFPTPPRSACVFCPYHSDQEWLRLKEEEPDDFQAAADFERTWQERKKDTTNMRSIPFLHRSCQPIDEVDFRQRLSDRASKDAARLQGGPVDPDQMDLFRNECEGLCGN